MALQKETRQDEPVVTKKQNFEALPKYQDRSKVTAGDDACIVLHGYGRVAPTEVHFIDEYKFVGGVGHNIPKSVANNWKKGTRPDGKPTLSRVYPQAILPAGSTEVDFAAAAGIAPMEPSKLAALIDASDAQSLILALGREKAVALAEQLMRGSTELPL